MANENEEGAEEGADDGFPSPKANDGFSAVDVVNEKLGFGASLAGLSNENARGAGVSSPCCDPPVDELALLLSGEGTTIAFNGDDERGL